MTPFKVGLKPKKGDIKIFFEPTCLLVDILAYALSIAFDGQVNIASKFKVVNLYFKLHVTNN